MIIRLPENGRVVIVAITIAIFYNFANEPHTLLEPYSKYRGVSEHAVQKQKNETFESYTAF